MENLKPQILELLQSIPSVNQVCFFYPSDWAEEKLPAITYYEAQNEQRNTLLDYTEYDYSIAFVIDIWAKKSSDTSRIALAVNDAMQELGFLREFSADLYEATTKIHHKNMRYGGVLKLETAELI